MSTLVDKRWEPMDTSGLPRRDRAGCDYQAYVPDPLVGREIRLTGETAADVADAEARVASLNAKVTTLAGSEVLARLLLRAEAVGSSHIEGLVVGGRRLLRAEAADALGEQSRDMTANEVLANIAAMSHAVDHLDGPVTVDAILEIHRLLLQDTDRSRRAGKIRDEQNWIGGSHYNPCSADFIPPPPEHVTELLEDLCEFVNGDSVSPVTQAALAHAQFETVHPFVDGNGRTGRALIHVVLRRRGLAPNVVPPISLILATRAADYVQGLSAFRYLGDPLGDSARDGLNRWLSTFAAAVNLAAIDALEFEDRIGQIEEDWRGRIGKVRSDSLVRLLVDELAGMPIITAKVVAERFGRSGPVTRSAIDRLVDAGVLRQTTAGRRNRAWEAWEVIDAFADFERALASPAGDTAAAPPVRAVPAKRP